VIVVVVVVALAVVAIIWLVAKGNMLRHQNGSPSIDNSINVLK